MDVPHGYSVTRAKDARSRWMVWYKGDPELFEKRINAGGQTRITTFKTKTAATQAAIDHAAMIAKLNAMPTP